MVMGVCKRVLHDEHLAADAFQSVFLVLARKARDVRVGDSLGRWLYGVSVPSRLARRRALAVRGRERNIEGIDRAAEACPSDACERAELCDLVDEEIARLPSGYRSIIVYCYLEGMTQEQAAERMRCPIGTVESRLHRARQRLRSRLSRRGCAEVGLGPWLLDEAARRERATVVSRGNDRGSRSKRIRRRDWYQGSRGSSRAGPRNDQEHHDDQGIPNRAVAAGHWATHGSRGCSFGGG